MEFDQPLGRAIALADAARRGGGLRPVVRSFFDPQTANITHVVHDVATGRAAVIDPVLGYDPAGGRLSTAAADQVVAYVRGQGLIVDWLLETHIHADHLTACAYLQEALGGRSAIGRRIGEVHAHFLSRFAAGVLPAADAMPFDRLLDDGDAIALGGVQGMALAVPGHTPADMAFLFGDALFVGDTLMMPDFGTARADFPGGDAAQLHASIARLLALPGETRMFLCHDYPPAERGAPCCETSVAAQRDGNVHVGGGMARAAFIAQRTRRDASLGLPRLIVESIQHNLRAGRLPEPDEAGICSFNIPLDRF